jgi:hypothetical protein
MADKITRIAIVDANRCKPKRCAQECKKVRNDLLVAISPYILVTVLSSREDGYVDRPFIDDPRTDLLAQANFALR